MLDPDMRNTIYQMHEHGISFREIARLFQISRNTVRKVIRQGQNTPRDPRRDRIHVDPELLQRLYRECEGWAQRIHERLTEEEHIAIGYSTLTRLLREQGYGQQANPRCDQVPDEPGLEMQHDTSPYRIPVGGKLRKLIASVLYLRYAKRRYLMFYSVFNRFKMKSFFHEALRFWGYAAGRCIIDNTNLARLRGSGAKAVIVPEMQAFGRQYGFEFICHEIGHANRKAGEERSFWTVETNFLPGRTFESLEDLNRQAFQWATERMDHRPQGKTRLIPLKAFEHEVTFLTPVSPHLSAPYQTHPRGIDQYGYVTFQANYYWVPGEGRGQVKVLEEADRLRIFQNHECLVEYALPPDGVKQQRFVPPGAPTPKYQPKNRHQRSDREAQQLRAMGEDVVAYLDFIQQAPGIQRHQYTRGLLELSSKLKQDVFCKALARALRYRITKLETVRRIAWWCLHELDQPLPAVEVDEQYRDRAAFREGCFTDLPDLSRYELAPEPPKESESK